MKVFAVLAMLAAGLGVACYGAAASNEFLLLRLDGTYVKWGAPRMGTPAQVRYAFTRADAISRTDQLRLHGPDRAVT